MNARNEQRVAKLLERDRNTVLPGQLEIELPVQPAPKLCDAVSTSVQAAFCEAR